MLDNSVSAAKARADVALWTAQEEATVLATEALDTYFSLPWTNYLANQAAAHATWWATAGSVRYLQWVSDQNAEQLSYTMALIANHHIKMEGDQSQGILGINPAKQAYALSLIATAHARDTDQAGARNDEIISLSTPTKNYLDNVSQAKRNREVDLAQLEADHAGSDNAGNDGQSENQIKDYYDGLINTYEQTQRTATQNAVSAWYTRLATAEHTATTQWTGFEVQYAGNNAGSEQWYDLAANGKIPARTDERGGINVAFSQDEVDSWVAGLGNLQSSPWATYALADHTHYSEEYLESVSAAQLVFDHAMALVEETRLNGNAQELVARKTERIGDWATQATTTANASLGSASNQASSLAQQAGNALPEPSTGGLRLTPNTAPPQIEEGLVQSPDKLEGDGLIGGIIERAAQTAIESVFYNNPTASLVAMAAGAALTSVVSTGSEDTSANPPPRWTKETVQAVMQAISEADPNLRHFATFWRTKVTLKDAPLVKAGMLLWKHDTYPFAVKAQYERNYETIWSKPEGVGRIERVFIDASPKDSAFEVARRVMGELGDGSSELSVAYLRYLIEELKQYDQNRLGGTDAIEDRKRRAELAVIAKAGQDAESYLKLAVSAVPGGTFIVAAKDLEQGNYVASGLGFLSLLPLATIIGAGINRIKFVAKNGDVVEVGIKILDDIPASQQAEASQQVVNAVKSSDDAADILNSIKAKAGAEGSAPTTFIGKLRGQLIELPGVTLQKIKFTKIDPVIAEARRAAFNSTDRAKFLKGLAADPAKVAKLKASGLADADILKLKSGGVPSGYQVHHKLPIDAGGSNEASNLVLIKNEPYHKAITNYHNEVTKLLNPGDSIEIDWPIVSGFTYP